MNKVEKTVLVMHSAEEMFTLVDSVEDYPNFLPWCSKVDIVERTDTITSATLHISYRGIKQNFTTTNSKVFPRSMDIQLTDGPFKHLEGDWHFVELRPDACKIEFRLEYAFANNLLEKLISPVFNYIATTFVDRFVAQADEIYVAKKD
ncbi:MAG: type II toxin-antitoxin system RatA family toxin [Methylophilaceae bacterium]